MSLPSQLDKSVPAGTDDPGNAGSELRALKQHLVDVYGIPDATNIDTAPFDIQTNGTTRMVQRLEEDKGANIASASSITVGTDGNFFDITGTTTITSLSSVQAGTVIIVNFTGSPSLTLTHNATSLILRGGADYVTGAGDTMAFLSLGSGNWKELFRSQRVGWNLIDSVTLSASATGTVTMTTGAHQLAHYDLYKAELTRWIPTTDEVDFRVRILQDDVVQTTSGDYKFDRTIIAGNAPLIGGQSGGDEFSTVSNDTGNTSDEGITGTMYISSPGATSFKRMWGRFSQSDEAGIHSFTFGTWIFKGDTAAINGIQFFFQSGTIASGEMKLYGLTK